MPKNRSKTPSAAADAAAAEVAPPDAGSVQPGQMSRAGGMGGGTGENDTAPTMLIVGSLLGVLGLLGLVFVTLATAPRDNFEALMESPMFIGMASADVQMALMGVQVLFAALSGLALLSAFFALNAIINYQQLVAGAVQLRGLKGDEPGARDKLNRVLGRQTNTIVYRVMARYTMLLALPVALVAVLTVAFLINLWAAVAFTAAAVVVLVIPVGLSAMWKSQLRRIPAGDMLGGAAAGKPDKR
jgi:hypothetical protein